MDWWLIVASLAVGLAVPMVRARGARRRQAALSAGRPVRLRVALSGDSTRRVAGWVTMVEGAPTWLPRWRTGTPPVPLAGARPLRAESSGVFLRPADTVVTVVRPDGTPLRLNVTSVDLPLLQDMLAAAPARPSVETTAEVPAPRPAVRAQANRGRVPWWSAALLGVAAAVTAATGWCWVAGSVVSASVVSHDVTACRVEWTDPADRVRHEDSVGCSATAMPGDTVDVLALPAMLTGDAVTVRDAVRFPAGVVVVLAVPALAGIVLRGRSPKRRLTWRATGAEAGEAGEAGEVPNLAEGEVFCSRVAEVMTARAAAEGWGAPVAELEPDAAPPPRHWWQVKVLRTVAGLIVGRIIVPTVVLVVAALLGGGAWLTTAALASSDTAVVYGSVDDNDQSRALPFLPYSTRVHFHVDGRWAYATVPSTRRLAQGQEVSVQYVLAHHSRARLDSADDGLGRSVATTAPVAALAAGLIAARLLRLRRDLAGLVKARCGPARPWRYVRFVDPAGGVGLMLFSRLDDGPPVAVLPLAPLGEAAERLPVTGEAFVHGEVVDRGLAVPVIAGHTCWPLGRAAAMPPEIVRNLVNGNLPIRRR